MNKQKRHEQHSTWTCEMNLDDLAVTHSIKSTQNKHQTHAVQPRTNFNTDSTDFGPPNLGCVQLFATH